MKYLAYYFLFVATLFGASLPSQNEDFIKSLKNICAIKASMNTDDCSKIAQNIAQRLNTKECMDDNFMIQTCVEQCQNTRQEKAANKKK